MTLHEQIDELETRLEVKMLVEKIELEERLKTLERERKALAACIASLRATLDRSARSVSGRPRRVRDDDAEPNPCTGGADCRYCNAN